MTGEKFIIKGNVPLKGTVRISGSKNASLPIIAGALLSKKKVTLHNIPGIQDIYSMINLLEYLNVKTEFKNNTLTIDAGNIISKPLEQKLVKKFRSSILLLAPLLQRTGIIEMIYPGGCPLGRRSIRAHLYALRDLGATIKNDIDTIVISTKELKGNDFTMWEASVTATENAIVAAVLASGESVIRLGATEPHTQDLCHFLNSLGAKIDGIGSPFLKITGVKELNSGEYTVTSDYLEAGTLAIAAALIPKSHVTLTHMHPHHLDAVWNKLRETGVRFKTGQNSVEVLGTDKLEAISKLDTRLFPYFPTDLQAPFAVLLTQAHGVSKIFETLFEGRLNYLYELEKMGVKMEILNPHQAIIWGPTDLKGANVASCDIRAGAAVVLAALAAKGTSEISNIDYIDRGYDNLEEKLRSLGANISRS